MWTSFDPLHLNHSRYFHEKVTQSPPYLKWRSAVRNIYIFMEEEFLWSRNNPILTEKHLIPWKYIYLRNVKKKMWISNKYRCDIVKRLTWMLSLLMELVASTACEQRWLNFVIASPCISEKVPKDLSLSGWMFKTDLTRNIIHYCVFKKALPM